MSSTHTFTCPLLLPMCIVMLFAKKGSGIWGSLGAHTHPHVPVVVVASCEVLYISWLPGCSAVLACVCVCVCVCVGGSAAMKQLPVGLTTLQCWVKETRGENGRGENQLQRLSGRLSSLCSVSYNRSGISETPSTLFFIMCFLPWHSRIIFLVPVLCSGVESSHVTWTWVKTSMASDLTGSKVTQFWR